MTISIKVEDITTVQTTDTQYNSTNTGVFDVLMESVNLQINKQYAAGRITGTDFANVYLGAIQSVLQQSVQFTLTKDSSELEAGLVEEQIAKIVKDTELVGEKILTERTNTVDPVGGAAKDKADLVKAQALGFSNNTKNGLLKIMADGYSSNLAIAGSATAPESTKSIAIDDLKDDILQSLEG